MRRGEIGRLEASPSLEELTARWERLLVRGAAKEFNEAVRLAVVRSIAGSGLLPAFFRGPSPDGRRLARSLLGLLFELVQVP